MTVKVKVKVAITSYTAELFITKLTAALFVICLECYETIRGHQKKGEKFKGQGQMCWRSCKEENMASDVLCEKFVVAIANN